MTQYKVSFNLPKDEYPDRRYYMIITACNKSAAYGLMMESMVSIPWYRSVDSWPCNVSVEVYHERSR